MSEDRVLKLEDTFEYKNIPFIVRVQEQEMYINGKNGEIRGINAYGNPTGVERNSRHWVLCRCLVSRVRPDYPYSVNHKYEEVDKHVKIIEPYELPKRSIIFYLN